MWATEHCFDPPTRSRNLSHHQLMDLLYRVPGHDTFADTCLFGDNQQPKTCLREPGDGTTRDRQELKFLPALYVVALWAIPVDDAITIQEDRLQSCAPPWPIFPNLPNKGGCRRSEVCHRVYFSGLHLSLSVVQLYYTENRWCIQD